MASASNTFSNVKDENMFQRDSIIKKMNELKDKKALIVDEDTQSNPQINAINAQLKNLYQDLDRLKVSRDKSAIEYEKARRDIRVRVLQDADIMYEISLINV